MINVHATGILKARTAITNIQTIGSGYAAIEVGSYRKFACAKLRVCGKIIQSFYTVQ